MNSLLVYAQLLFKIFQFLPSLLTLAPFVQIIIAASLLFLLIDSLTFTFVENTEVIWKCILVFHCVIDPLRFVLCDKLPHL